MYKIVRREQFSESTFLWDVEAPDVALAAEPGHFVMLRLREGGERIPLTVADFDRDRGTVTIVVQALGKTTWEMLKSYRAGDTFRDFVGPLGLPSELQNYGHVVLVGGGLGVAPVFPQLRGFKNAGNRTTAILGFRSKDLVFWEERFQPFCDDLILCTDDGTYGRKGLVTEALAEVLQQHPDRVVAVGPLPMMRACAEVTRATGIPTVVSLNAIMVDGTGMCGSCRVTIGGDIRFACVDGPEFDAHKVDFDELVARQRRFSLQEGRAHETFNQVCNLQRLLFEEEKRNYKKIKALSPKAVEMPERNAAERARNFKEVNLGYSMEDAMQEAERCIQCKIPYCIAGCPVAINIPKFIRHLLVRDVDKALAVIQEENLFPSICGRVCPQESQCEAQCIIGKKVEPVAIGRLERFVGDFGRGVKARPHPEQGKLGKVAIVGSGPGALACAADLAKAGADVTIFEALHVVGGVLSYGIPPFRLPPSIIEREISGLKDLGVKFELNKVVGKTFTVHQLREEKGFGAVFIATGAGYPTFLGIPGEHAGRVYSANEFLTRINLMGGQNFPYEDTPVSVGNNVVVFGAGNTAMDCLRVSKRLGAEAVHCVYRRTEAEAPARVEEIRHAKEEGIDFHWLWGPVAIELDEQGSVAGVHCQRMELGPPDDSGRRRPLPIEGALERIPCDTVIYALGTSANPIIAQSTKDLELNRWGYIVADENSQATSIEGVFAGGDIVTGGATVILAMGAGRRAANGIQEYLKTGQWPPVVQIPEVKSAKKPKKKVKPAARLCPKCQRPIDGKEEYLCCGGQKLIWQCTDCAKVYDGFAFPYGLCPACGGELSTDFRPDTEGKEAHEAIRQAFEIELGGMAFFAKGAKEAQDPKLKDLFSRLAKMEEEHNATLAKRYHVETSAPSDDGPSFRKVAVYADHDLPTEDGVALLKLAIRLEQRARDFFAEQRHKLDEGTAAWKLYRELEAEEVEHVDMLQTELTRFAQDKPGFL